MNACPVCNKIDRAKAAHRRRWGEGSLSAQEVRRGVVRVTDIDAGNWSEWNIRGQRVRRIDDGHPAA